MKYIWEMYQANLGQVCKQAAIFAGIPESMPCTTVIK